MKPIQHPFVPDPWGTPFCVHWNRTAFLGKNGVWEASVRCGYRRLSHATAEELRNEHH
jgi:hypothetical protein